MASTKIYTVVKDGEELEKMKNLTAAKKLADTEGAEVYSDGRCVYRAVTETVETTVPEAVEEAPVAETPAEPAKTEEKAKAGNAEKYRIRTLMNVRKSPSMESDRIGLKNGGDVVSAVLKGDWLQLSEGGFVLFGSGEFAEKV